MRRKAKPSAKRRNVTRRATSARPSRPAKPSRPPLRSLQPGEAGELFTAQGFRLPAAVREELKQAAGDLFWSLVADEQLGEELTGPQAAVLRAVAEKFLQHGFVLAVCRYVRDLRRVPELRQAYKQRSATANAAKRKKPRRSAGTTYTLDERDAAIVTEYAALVSRMSATSAQFTLAEKHGIGEKQIRNILGAARKAAR